MTLVALQVHNSERPEGLDINVSVQAGGESEKKEVMKVLSESKGPSIPIKENRSIPDLNRCQSLLR